MNQTTTPKKKEKDNTLLYAGALLLLGYGAYAYNNANKTTTTSTGEDNLPNPDIAPIKPAVKPIAIYVTKILKMGSQGLEVTKLQGLMKITADGFFGPQTEAMLFRLKGVKEVSLDQYGKLPNVNRNVYPAGTKLQSPLRAGTPIYNAKTMADGSYYSDEIIEKTIDYGQAVGTVRTASPLGNWYTIYYDTFWGQKIGFVKATDVQSYQ